MRWSTVFLFLLSTMALAGCKKEPGPTEDAPSTTAPETAHDVDEPTTAPGEGRAESEGSQFSKATPAVLEVLERGEEPRRTLGWSAEPGVKQILKITVDTEFEALIGILNTKQAPRSEMFELTLETDESALDEPRFVSFTINEARVLDSNETPPKVRKKLEEAMGVLPGLQGRYPVDSLGTLEEVVLNLPLDASREAQSIASDLKWALRQLAVAFPAEPVGPGATWTVGHRIDQNGIDANEVSTLKITKVHRQLVTMERDVQQTAEPQTVRKPGSASNAELTKFTAQGGSKIVWELTKPAPRFMKMTLTENKRLHWEFQGQRVMAEAVTKRALRIGREGSDSR